MLVVPVAAATLVARSFEQSVRLVISAAEFATIAGVTVADIYGIVAGGLIVLAAIGVYATVLVRRKLTTVSLVQRLPTRSRQPANHSAKQLKTDGSEKK